MSRQQALMQLFDDELPPDEAATLEADLSDEELAQLEGLSQLSEMVRAHAETQRGGLGIADAVMARLDGVRVKDATTLRAVPGGRADADRARPGKLLLGISAALAAAAAVAMFAGRMPTPAPTAVAHHDPTAVAPPLPAPSLAPAAAPVVEEGELTAAIESIEFGSTSGAIFMVSAGTETTPVVWLNDETAEPGDRTEPL
jgi:hypothetical protein